MDTFFKRPFIPIIFLVLISAYLFFFQLGGMALTDPDETFYAQTAKEMASRNEWTTPYLYGKPQFEKPIFFYWMVEASYKIFGVNEFAARFPSAVFALAGVIALYVLGTLLFNRRAGFLAALTLASSVEYVILARACVTDMVLTVWILLGILFVFAGIRTEKTRYYIGAAASFGFAVLTKGPVFLLLIIAVFFFYLLFAKKIKMFLKMPIFWSVVTFALVALPWYIFAYRLHGSAFINEFFGFHNMTRFMQSEHKIGSQIYYNIPIILGGFFPWSVFLPFGFWHAVKVVRSKGHSEEKDALIFVLALFFVVFLFFTASSTKLPTYIFPLFISLALLTGFILDEFLKRTASAIRGVRISYYSLLALSTVASIGALVFLYFDFPSIIIGVGVSLVFLLLGFWLSYISFRRGHDFTSFLLIAYAVMVFLYPFDKLVVNEIERYESSKGIAAKLVPLMSPGERLGAESNYLAGLAFYAGVAPVNLDRHHDLVQFLNSDDFVWAVIKEKNHRQLYDQAVNHTYVKETYLVDKIGKRAIVTNGVPEAGTYMTKREWK